MNRIAALKTILTTQAAKFLVVGTLGFLADMVVLLAVIELADIAPVWARAFSFPPAFALTWLLNRHWTFEQGRERKPLGQLAIYFFVQMAGFIVNYSVYALLVTRLQLMHDLPALALAIGSIIALFVTFTLSKLVAFAAPGRTGGTNYPQDTD